MTLVDYIVYVILAICIENNKIFSFNQTQIKVKYYLLYFTVQPSYHVNISRFN
jgi:hypothetical protein